ncbi:T9SS type A sorting domain-containing protein [bacterium]|nr:T9SS type A sorting domain-containing protein [bacterium]
MKATRLLFFLACCMAQIHYSGAQNNLKTYFLTQGQYPLVLQKGDTLFDAFTGGFHEPLFSNIDLNFDGIPDLLVYDKHDKKTLTFVGNGNTKNPLFSYAPQFEEVIPPLSGWLRLADYNRDGLPDIFTGNEQGGVRVYRNTSQQNTLRFKLFSDDLKHYDAQLHSLTSFVVTETDQPAVVDIDGDGDIDVLSFDFGNSITFYENLSLAVYGHTDSFNSVVNTYCWGRFSEGFTSNQILLNAKCGLWKRAKDVGSAMLAIDLDNDGDKDLLLSDVNSRFVVQLTNGRNPYSGNAHNRDSFVKVTQFYPHNSKRIKVDLFPSINNCDVDFDGVEDLLLAPSRHDSNFAIFNTWFYKNTGSNEKPVYEFKRRDFIQRQNVEMGEKTETLLYDVDADGDLDLLLGAPLPYHNRETDKAFYRLFLYENTGSPNRAIFSLKDSNYLDLLQRELLYIAMAFGDIDNNGTDDLLIGTQRGRITVFANKAARGNPIDLDEPVNAYKGVKVSNYAAPLVYDANGDGKNDLLVGDMFGKIFLFLAKGDSFQLESNALGKLKTNGFARPVMADFANDGKPDLLVADSYGYLFLVDDFDAKTAEFNYRQNLLFNLEFDTVVLKDFGARLVPAVGDLNCDTIPDMLLGNSRGGLLYLTGILKRYNTVAQQHADLYFAVYPNPNNGQVVMSWQMSHATANLQIINSTGSIVFSGTVTNKELFNYQQLEAGMYIFKLSTSSNQVFFAKVIKVQ